MKILSILLSLVSAILVGFFVWIYFISPSYVVYSSSTSNLTISPTQSFEIKFSSSISGFDLENIKVHPQTKVNTKLNKNTNTISLKPVSNWELGANYTIEIPETRLKNLKKINYARHNFKVVSFPKITKVVPKNDTQDLEINFEKPIEVFLDKFDTNFYIDFFLEPATPIKITRKNSKFEILPAESLKNDTEYTLKAIIKIKDIKNETVEKYSSTFKTELPKPKKWAKNHSERLKQAQRYTKAKITDGKYIDINLTNQVMSIFENGKNIDSFMISTGKPGMRTPVGNHKIYNKFPRPYSKKYGLYMPNWMAITPTGSHGIHELPEWPGGYKEGQNHLGIPVSHGCVRLGVGAAKKVYDWAEIGTPVIVYYGKI